MEREEYWEGRVLKTPFTFPSSTTRKLSSIDLMELSDSDQMILPLTTKEPSILITFHHYCSAFILVCNNAQHFLHPFDINST